MIALRIVQTVLLTLAFAFPLRAATPWNPVPWLEDLKQIRAAIGHQYPNCDWLIEQREVSLDREFDRAESALRRSDSDSVARTVLSLLMVRFADGHVSLRWPSSQNQKPKAIVDNTPMRVASFCAVNSYDAMQVTLGTASAMLGYPTIGAVSVFDPAQFPYRDTVWKGPIIVLVDGQTLSAAEQFASLLRDNFDVANGAADDLQHLRLIARSDHRL